MNLLRLLVSVLLAVLVPAAVAAALGFLLATEAGARWLLAERLPEWSGGRVRVASVEGRLVEGVELRGLEVAPGGATRLRARVLHLAWSPHHLLAGRLQVDRLHGEGLELDLPPPGEPAPPRREAIRLPAVELPLAVRLVEGRLADVRLRRGDTVHRLESLALAGRWNDDGLAVERLELQTPEATLHGDGTVAPARDWRLDLQLDWQYRLADTTLAGAGRLHGPLARLEVEHRLQAPVAVTTRGRVRPLEPRPAFDLAGDWRQLGWPLEETPRFTARDGRYALQGTPEDVSILLDTGLAAAGLPGGQLALEGHWDGQRLALAPLTLETLEGRLTARGTLRPAAGPAWDLELAGEGLDPGAWRPEWPGELALEARSSGRITDDGPEAAIVLERLAGTLRGFPVEGRLRGEYAAGRLVLDEARLRSGEARAAASGHLGESLALDWSLDAPRLEPLWPGLTGGLEAEGTARGPLGSPRIVAEYAGREVALGELAVARFEGRAAVDAARPESARLALDARGLAVGERRWDSLALEIAPRDGRQRLDLALGGEPGDLELGAALRPASGDRWEGRLERLALRLPAVGEWRLEAPAGLALSPAGASLAQACLVAGSARLCAEGGWQAAGESRLNARLERFPLAAEIAEYLPAPVTARGTLDGTLRAETAGEGLEAELDLRLEEAGMRLAAPGKPVLDLPLESPTLAARLDDGRLEARVAAGLGEAGRIDGRAFLLRGGRAWDEATLDGNLDLRLTRFELLDPFVPGLAEPRGTLDAELVLAGRVARPEVLGRATVTGRAEVPELGITLENVSLSTRARPGEPVTISGRLESGAGHLQLDGRVTDPAGERRLRLGVTGERFRIADTPRARVAVSPVLGIEFADRHLQVNGNVLADPVHVHLRQLPEGSAQVSEDAVVVRRPAGAEGPAETAGPPVATHARVRLDLGEDVSVDAFGFQGALAGGLMLDQTPDRGLLADGEIRITEGRYTAYGQKLSVRDGRLSFAGVADNPGLDVEAVRRAGEVTAGVRVGGTLERPETTLFSEPPMNDGDILSYLVLGRPLGETAGDQRSALVQAALGMGLKQGDMLAQEIGARLGFDEVGVDSSGGLETASLVFGKYLTPDLYLRYAMGVFDAQNRVELDYRVSDRVSLEAQSGAEAGVDLFYTIEKD